MLTLDKILTTVSSTAFVHRHRYNQQKLKHPQGALKIKVEKAKNEQLENEVYV